MKKYANQEVITPVIILLFLFYYLSETLKLSSPIVNNVPQESFFPYMILVVGFGAAISLLISGIRKSSKYDTEKPEVEGNSEEKAQETKKKNVKPVLAILATAIFVFIFSEFGFWCASPLYVFVMQILYDDKPQQLLKKILLSLIICGIVYSLYTYGFDVNFPDIWR